MLHFQCTFSGYRIISSRVGTVSQSVKGIFKINRVTSTQWRQQSDINRVTSTEWHQQSDINRVTSTEGHKQSDINRVTSTEWHQTLDFKCTFSGYRVLNSRVGTGSQLVKGISSNQQSDISIVTQSRHSIVALNYGTQLRHSVMITGYRIWDTGYRKTVTISSNQHYCVASSPSSAGACFLRGKMHNK